MALTKPAGVALQILGFFLILGGAAWLSNGRLIEGLLVLAVGMWAFIAGRKPAATNR